MTATRTRSHPLPARAVPGLPASLRKKLFDRFKHYYTSIACWAAADNSPRCPAFGETFASSPAPSAASAPHLRRGALSRKPLRSKTPAHGTHVACG
jgi:hypothetical protein